MTEQNGYSAPRRVVSSPRRSRHQSRIFVALASAALAFSLAPFALTIFLVNQEFLQIIPVGSTLTGAGVGRTVFGLG